MFPLYYSKRYIMKRMLACGCSRSSASQAGLIFHKMQGFICSVPLVGLHLSAFAAGSFSLVSSSATPSRASIDCLGYVSKVLQRSVHNDAVIH